VTVQPYNTLLSMSTLAELSSGILLLQNEALHASCTRLLGIKHPSFKASLDRGEREGGREGERERGREMLTGRVSRNGG